MMDRKTPDFRASDVLSRFGLEDIHPTMFADIQAAVSEEIRQAECEASQSCAYHNGELTVQNIELKKELKAARIKALQDAIEVVKAGTEGKPGCRCERCNVIVRLSVLAEEAKRG